MTDTEFRQLVARMRQAQRSYFKTRAQTFLIESRKLEAEVDREIAPPPRVDQGQLFGGSNGRT